MGLSLLDSIDNEQLQPIYFIILLPAILFICTLRFVWTQFIIFYIHSYVSLPLPLSNLRTDTAL